MRVLYKIQREVTLATARHLSETRQRQSAAVVPLNGGRSEKNGFINTSSGRNIHILHMNNLTAHHQS